MAVAARQQRGGAVVAETLVGAAIGHAFGAQARYQQGLQIIVFVGANAERIAHLAAGAVGSDQQARMQLAFAAVVGDADRAHVGIVHDLVDGDETRRPVAGQVRKFAQARFQRRTEVARHHHATERVAAVVAGIELDAAEVATAAGMDARDLAHRRLQLVEHAQRGERIDRGVGEAQVALVEHRRQRPGRGGLDHADIQPDAVQRDRQAGADQAAADDQYVVARRIIHRPGGTGCGRRWR